MINVGDFEISGVYVGDVELSVYVGDELIYPTSTANLTGISLDNLTWVTDVPASGGTATSANCSYTVTGYYDDSTTKNITNKCLIFGSLGVEASTIETRHYIQDLLLVAMYPATGETQFSSSSSVGVYQAAYSPCNPVILVNNLGNRNNQNYSHSGFYAFDSGITEINSCYYDFSGITCICSRDDGFYSTPNAFLGRSNGGMPTSSDGCLRSVQTIEIDCTTVTKIAYPFGNDSQSQFCQTVTSITLTNTDRVTTLTQLALYCTNLVNLNLGSFASVTSDGKEFQSCPSLTNITIAALPKRNINWGFDNLSNLTEQSVINILNALPSNASNTITIGTRNKNKLTSAAGIQALADAQSKGWTVN